MYCKPADEKELAAFGLTRADVGEEDDIEVWQCNTRPVYLFVEMQTQWRVGQGGPTGLDYGPLFTRLARIAPEPEDHESLFADVRVLESAALEQMAANNDSQE